MPVITLPGFVNTNCWVAGDDPGAGADPTVAMVTIGLCETIEATVEVDEVAEDEIVVIVLAPDEVAGLGSN